MNKLLTINEASEMLGVKRSTLYSWIHQDKIPHIKIGKLVKFKIDQIEAFIESNTINPINTKSYKGARNGEGK